MQLTPQQMRAFAEALDGLMNPDVPKGGNPEFAFVLIVGSLDGRSIIESVSNISMESEAVLIGAVKEQLDEKVERALKREKNPN